VGKNLIVLKIKENDDFIFAVKAEAVNGRESKLSHLLSMKN